MQLLYYFTAQICFRWEISVFYRI